MDGEKIGSQLKAARKLAGFETTAKLAEAIGRARFGARVIGNIERNQRVAQEHEIRWLAEATGRPVDFFTSRPERPRATEASVEELLDQQSETLAAINEAIKELRDAMKELRNVQAKQAAAARSLHNLIRTAAQSLESATGSRPEGTQTSGSTDT